MFVFWTLNALSRNEVFLKTLLFILTSHLLGPVNSLSNLISRFYRSSAKLELFSIEVGDETRRDKWWCVDPRCIVPGEEKVSDFYKIQPKQLSPFLRTNWLYDMILKNLSNKTSPVCFQYSLSVLIAELKCSSRQNYDFELFFFVNSQIPTSLKKCNPCF